MLNTSVSITSFLTGQERFTIISSGPVPLQEHPGGPVCPAPDHPHLPAGQGGILRQGGAAAGDKYSDGFQRQSTENDLKSVLGSNETRELEELSVDDAFITSY